jgi:hypothetical protein
MSMNPCRAKPCDECPWRREALSGWLGPLNANEWAALVQSDEPVACHKTITSETSGDVAAMYDLQSGLLQCAGAAQMRTNSMKVPRDPEVAVAAEVDREAVFGSVLEFLGHHGSTLTEYLAEIYGVRND